VSPEIFSTDPSQSPTTQWCVVFDTRTGNVVHVHQFIALRSADALSREELAELALGQVSSGDLEPAEALPSRDAPDRGYLDVAWPAADVRLGSGERLHVDLETRQVVTQPPQ
jgi:hypothetical protein